MEVGFHTLPLWILKKNQASTRYYEFKANRPLGIPHSENHKFGLCHHLAKFHTKLE